jgi:hydrogenase maturation protease
MESRKTRILVVGLGNPNLGDDGVGWRVAEEVKRRLPPDQPVNVLCLSLGGVSLMEHLIGYECAILVDAFTLEEPTGSILILKLNDIPHFSAFHTTNRHDTPLQTAIELGKSMGAQLPDDVMVVGIATKHVCSFSTSLSPSIEQAVPQAVSFVMDLLGEKVQADKK